MILKRTNAFFDRTNVNNINDNWDIIEERISDSNIKNIINQLKDEHTTDEVIARIYKAVQNYTAIETQEFIKNNPELFKGDTGDKINYLKVDKENDFTAFLKISDEDYVGNRYYKDTEDEFLKGYENYIIRYSKEISNKIYNNNYSDIKNGTMTYTTFVFAASLTDNAYSLLLNPTVKFAGFSTFSPNSFVV